MAYKNKDLLGLSNMKKEEIKDILDTAGKMKSTLLQGNKRISCLQGKSMVTLFYEDSTRTRLSFELAGKYMSANSSHVSASSSSVQKGETLVDTARTIDRMGVDFIILRHPMAGAPHLIAKHVQASVINAGDGMNEHPTQALLDIFTMREKKGKIKGRKVAIIGDIAHSRVARSNIWGLMSLGAEVWLSGPPSLIPLEMERTGAKVTFQVEEALKNADVVMGLRLQRERQASGFLPGLREYSRYFGINERNLKYAKPDAIIMHPGPLNRGTELTSEVLASKNAVVEEQVTNGVAVRMALLFLLAERRKKGKEKKI